ncbi:T9SS type A sorting domain-containing protein [Saprospira sp. CCB-QB6]|uniref:T9SS type A sorting domain-containing protein n=1 Tax=Saprospira sp. CCB-QB6 TaxID=3023936 RepID=UPI00234B2A9A|nr:PA domain-containing protein [Saprospira sp. CCB-QB6]WCL80701.1 T9SS type A sorting domain-containing protein [Saprospira sp. CCB-QB6]
MSFLLMGLGLSAQQLEHPMVVEVNTPASISGTYVYGYQSDWGPTSLAATITGEAAWARTAANDSIACDSVVNDLTGKVALVRRGACNFSLKTLNAQTQGAVACVICNNQPGAGVINMAGGTFGAQVNIPAVMLSYEDCALLANAMDAGDTVNITFRKPALVANRTSTYAYRTPLSQVHDLDLINIGLINTSPTAVPQAIVKVDITDPANNVTSYMDTLSLAADTVIDFHIFEEVYPAPTDTGRYQIVFSADYTTDTVFQDFVVTENTFALDNGNPADQRFYTLADFSANRYDVGACFYTADTVEAFHWASFGLGPNPDYIQQQLNVFLYKAKPGVTITGQDVDYSKFDIVAVNSHNIRAEDTASGSLIIKRLYEVQNGEDSIVLDSNTLYALVVSFRGNGSIVDPPYFEFAGNGARLDFSTIVHGTDLSMGGFGGPQVRVRMHKEASYTAETPTGSGLAVNESPLLEAASLSLFPNPTQDLLNLNIVAVDGAEEAIVSIMTATGQVLKSQVVALNGQNTIEQVQLKDLPAGAYLAYLQIGNKFTVKQFVKQ